MLELEVTELAAGLRPGTPDNLPVIGRDPATGLVAATGHHRNGILLTPVTAELVVELVGVDAAARPRGGRCARPMIVLNGVRVATTRPASAPCSTSSGSGSTPGALPSPSTARSSPGRSGRRLTLADGSRVEVVDAIQGG